MESTVRASNTGVVFARILAVLGTVLVGLPLAAPIVFALVGFFTAQRWRLDYLMPGELFVVVIAGGVAILAAALIVRRLRAAAATALGLVAFFLVLVDVIALTTGLASGETAATGWPLVLVAGTYVLYVVAVVSLFIVGVVVCRFVFRATGYDRSAGGIHDPAL